MPIHSISNVLSVHQQKKVPSKTKQNFQLYQAVSSRKYEAVGVSLLNFSDIPMYRINHLENKVEFYNRLEILNSIYLHA